MDPKAIMLLVICMTVALAAGCTTHSLQPSTSPAVSSPLSPATPATTATVGQVTGTSGVQTLVSQLSLTTTVSSGQAQECTSNENCVPAGCCHPSGCVKKAARASCDGIYCTMDCSGPLDCGAGSCGCVNGKCSIVSGSPAPVGRPGITIKASPKHYSLMMSSTPGVGLEPVITGFHAQDATFTWNATYGHFLSWNPPDFKVNQLGDSVQNHGEKLYWSYTDKPSPMATPVIITITATDTRSGRVLGSATVTLAWDGDYAVTVLEVE